MSDLAGGEITLANDGSDTTTVKHDGSFAFPLPLATGAPYLVTIVSAPSGQVCQVANAYGHLAHADVTDIGVSCHARSEVDGGTYTVSGHVSGLEGSSVTLLNGPDHVTVMGDGPFLFPVSLANGAPYAVTIAASPTGHACSAMQNIGHIDAADVTDVVVACPSTVATLASLTTSLGDITPAFTPATLAYTTLPVLVPLVGLSTSATVTATTTDKGATIAVNGMPAASGAPSPAFTVPVGSSMATVVVTAADGVSTTTYAVGFSAGAQEAYVKPSNTATAMQFGTATALSNDGNTLAVGASDDRSAATGVNGDATDTSAYQAGAVHIFTRSQGTWSEQAYLKASNTRPGALFGAAVTLSSDGNTLAVGSPGESSAATGVNGNQSDTSVFGAGAIYVFTRAGGAWSQVAYLKSAAATPSKFGSSVALSGDALTLAASAVGDASNATGIDGDPTSGSDYAAGAAYVFASGPSGWEQEAYVKPSDTSAYEYFGTALALSGDGNTLAAGAPGEVFYTGACFIFSRVAGSWSEQASVHASNAAQEADFGCSTALSADGATLVVGACNEASGATGVNGAEDDDSAPGSGAAYVFLRAGSAWSQSTYIKASNNNRSPYLVAGVGFGAALSLSGDGDELAVGAPWELSDATGIDGNQSSVADPGAGAVYLFMQGPAGWVQSAYVKASNTIPNEAFGGSATLSGDGATLACGATGDSSDSRTINGNETNNASGGAGAVFVFH